MGDIRRGVVLVGHGGIPKDFPYDEVTKLKRLEGQRKASGGLMSSEEVELESKIRHWPRNPENDPYQAGLEALAAKFRPLLDGALFKLAYNEFCAPTMEEAVEQIIKDGAEEITIVSTMFTPGGSHSEFEIPEELQQLRRKHPGVTLTYAWPFDLGEVAVMLAQHIKKFQLQHQES